MRLEPNPNPSPNPDPDQVPMAETIYSALRTRAPAGWTVEHDEGCTTHHA